MGLKMFQSQTVCRVNAAHGFSRYTNNRKCVGCARVHAKTPNSIKRVKDAYAAMSHPEKMVSWAKYRHKYKKYPGVFNLDIASVHWPEFCPALGIKLKYEAQRDRNANDAPTIDRINPDLGYTLDNVQIISRKANRIKNDGTPEEVMKVAIFMKGNSQ